MKQLNNIAIFNRISFLDKLLFTKHLSVMVKAGIPLADSLGILEKQTQNLNFKKVITKIHADIANGQSFKKALSSFPHVFDNLYLSLIEVGEESGKLEENLEYLAKELQKSYEFKQKVRNAMLYPSFVILVALIVGFGIAFFVLPNLANLFSSLDIKLPLTTQILIFIAEVMRKFGMILIPAIVAGIFGFKILVGQQAIKPLWQKFLLGLPILGKFLQNIESATFCRSLGLMLQSGLPISKALSVVADSTDNVIFHSYIQSLAKAIDKGKSMEAELDTNRYPLFPPIISKMIGVGEKTGKLDESLLYLGDFFEEEVDSMSKNLPTVLEPILLVVIALMVGFVALAIISPIYQFTSSIRR